MFCEKLFAELFAGLYCGIDPPPYGLVLAGGAGTCCPADDDSPPPCLITRGLSLLELGAVDDAPGGFPAWLRPVMVEFIFTRDGFEFVRLMFPDRRKASSPSALDGLWLRNMSMDGFLILLPPPWDPSMEPAGDAPAELG